MRKSRTHLALDRKANRFTVSKILGSLRIRDAHTGKETLLHSGGFLERHGHHWTEKEVYELCDWLNERAAGYPKHPMLTQHMGGNRNPFK